MAVWNWSRRVRVVVRTRESFWDILAGCACKEVRYYCRALDRGWLMRRERNFGGAAGLLIRAWRGHLQGP